MSANIKKTRALSQIEEKLLKTEEGTLRYQTLEAAKNFKKSWIEFGQFLYAVSRDKQYREWGYLSFEAYCKGELGIKKETAGKLLRSYYFLEYHEPEYIHPQNLARLAPGKIPPYEAVNTLRLAKENSRVSEEDYALLRKDVLEDQADPREVKKKFRYILKSSQTDDEADDAEDKKNLFLKKLQNALKILSENREFSRLIRREIIVKADELRAEIEKELSL